MNFYHDIEDSIEVIEKDLLERLKFGKAIVFTGAGFSSDMKNIEDNRIPLSKDLSHSICELGGFEKDDDLSYSTDRFLSMDSANKSKLISLLKNKLTVKNVDDTHKIIANFDWYRCYTTNYDNGFSKAALDSGKLIEDVELTDSIEKVSETENLLCVHINGQLSSLKKDSFNSNFKLTSSSYLSKDDFFKSKWFSVFKKDLEQASVIIFIGYSLYDDFIQKILFWDESSFKHKTFFITKKDINESVRYKFKKFGRILNIEVAGFADFLNRHKNDIVYNIDDKEITLSLLPYKYSIDDNNSVLSDTDLEKLFLFGKFEVEHLYNFIRKKINSETSNGFDSFIYREHNLKKSLDLIRGGNHIILLSELGNGKSIYLEMLKAYISITQEYDIYYLDNNTSLYTDFDKIHKKQRKSVIFIDGIHNNIEFIEYIKNVNHPNILIILAMRTIEFDNHKDKFINFYLLNLDLMYENELDRLVMIIDNLGFWSDKLRGYDFAHKVKYLKDKCNSQFSTILLDVFDSENIKEKLKKSFDCFKAKDEKDVLFVICFMSIYGQGQQDKIYKHVISDLSLDKNLIYKVSFTNNEAFKTLFKNNSSYVEVRSSLFCLSLIRNFFDTQFIIQKLLDMAEYLDCNKGNVDGGVSIFKTILKYSTIERLLPNQSKLGGLATYYDNLKKRINWLAQDPHFWLQYAMCQMSIKEYDKAQKYLDVAYEYAEKKEGYHVHDFNTQQARLFLLIGMKNKNSNIAYEYFEKSHSLLLSVPNDIHRYRQVFLYKEFFDNVNSILSKAKSKLFNDSVLVMVKEIDKLLENDNLYTRGYSYINSVKQKLLDILEKNNK